MSNSDLNFKDNKTIYEIFRACRLCGAGGGYKMPIIQDVVGLDCDVELKQKIRECVQIEVSEDDKMPPLICELCVDKVNDFYEFLDMCRQTNKKTRSRLGLPPQAVQEASDGDCILGITETVFANESEDSPARPTSRPRPKSVKLKEEQKKNLKEEKTEEEKMSHWKDEQIKSLTRELQNLKQLQLENTLSPRESRQRANSRETRQKEPPKESRQRETSRESLQRGTTRESRLRETSRESRQRETSNESRQRAFRSSTIVNRIASKGRASPPPIRETRQNTAESENVCLSVLRKNDLKKNEKAASQPTRATKETPAKSILKKEKEKEVENGDNSLLVPLGKRSRHKAESLEADLAAKRVKITIKLPPPTPKVMLEKVSKKEDKVDKPAKLEKVTKKEVKVEKPAKLEKVTKKEVKVEKPAKLEKATKKVEEVVKKDKEDLVDNTEENYDCNICGRSIKTNAGLSNHLKFSHIPNFTSCLMACNACGLWFENDDQTAAHHKRYHNTNPYHCRWCKNDFKLHKTYTAHFHKEHCVPCPLKPFMCTKCSKKFDTAQLKALHRCLVIKPAASSSLSALSSKSTSLTAPSPKSTSLTTPSSKSTSSPAPPKSTSLPAPSSKSTLPAPSSKSTLPAPSSKSTLPAPSSKSTLPAPSSKSASLPATLSSCGKQRGRNFKKQESSCSAKKRSILDEVRIAPRVRSRLLPASVRVARCDPLLKRGRCRASQVPNEFGLDQNTVYPYLATRVRIKSEPFIADGMVSINNDIKDELYTEEDYVHWDSDLSSSDDEYDNVDPKKRVDALFTLSLKTIFSRRCLGKVPRKLRKLKTEKFDLFNEYDMSGDISKIINNLGGNDAFNYDSDSLLEHDKEKKVVNSDFDSIFNASKSQSDVILSDETDCSRNDASRKDSNNKNKDAISMGSETDASVEEQDKNQIKTKEIEGSEINNVESMDTSNIGDDLKDKVTTESKNEQDTDRNPNAAQSKEMNNVESIDASNAGEEIEKKVNESDKVGTNYESNQNGIDSNEDSLRLNDKNGYENVSAESDKRSEKINGDAERVDTVSLMDEIDAQIQSGYQKNDGKVADDKNAGDRNSLGAENVSDEEFDFDA